jgi:hypothetical protein
MTHAVSLTPQITTERDKLRTQRDQYAKQFDELSNLRGSESEKLFTALKEKSDMRAKSASSVSCRGDCVGNADQQPRTKSSPA